MKRFLKLFILIWYHILGISTLLLLLPVSFIYKKKRRRKLNGDIIVLSSVAISYDGRIQKSLSKLIQTFDKVQLVKPRDTIEEESIIRAFAKNIVLRGRSGSYSYFPYCFDFETFIALLFSKASYIYCHDVPTCLMGFMLSRISPKMLIVDLHEWMSETVNISKNGVVTHLSFVKKWIFERIEYLVLNSADHVITVSYMLGELIKKKYSVNRNIIIIRNTGSIMHHANSINLYDSYDNQSQAPKAINLIYFGQINAHRNIENLLHCLQECKGFNLWIQGTCSDTYKSSLIKIIKELQISERVRFLPPVPPSEVIASIKKADIGIMSCKTFSKNLKNSLPNKVFEYIYAELPFICENLPAVQEMTRGCSFIKFFNSDDIQSITEALQSINNNFLKTKKEIQAFKKQLFKLDDFDQYSTFRHQKCLN